MSVNMRHKQAALGGKDASRRVRCGRAILAAGALLALSGTVLAEPPQKEMSADEVAKELSNPATALSSLFNSLVYTRYKGDLPGADSQDSWSFQFQPVLPFPVGDKGRNIIFRPLVTVPFNQPVFDAGQGKFEDADVELADTTFELVYAGNKMKDKHNGLLWGVGVGGTVPTATDDSLGGDQWRLGPAVFGGVLRTWGLLGLVIENQWDVAGSNNDAYSVTSGQYFYAYGLGGGWQIAASPTFAYNWKADSDQAWTFPVGIGVAKTAKIRSTPVKFQAQVQYFVEQPDAFGPDVLLKFSITPVIQNPFVR